MAVFVVQELHSTGICILSILNQFLDTRDSSDQQSQNYIYYHRKIQTVRKINEEFSYMALLVFIMNVKLTL